MIIKPMHVNNMKQLIKVKHNSTFLIYISYIIISAESQCKLAVS